jgi:hypothetical protein
LSQSEKVGGHRYPPGSQAAHLHFKGIYTEDSSIINHHQVLILIPLVIHPRSNQHLIALVTLKEIKSALDNMDSDKALGPNGFTARFLQVCWPIIKHDLHKLVIKSQKCHKIGGSTNSMFLALIPKEKGALSFDRFRPISLCNIGYKIITKVITNRLKGILPTIIPENQGGFIKGRHITDNIILVQEAIHSSMHQREKGMVVKLDLENSFDRVRHEFLFQVM